MGVDIREQLARPFGEDEVRQRPGRGGGSYDYIDARSAHQRLDEVFGPLGWQTRFIILDKESKAVECALSVFDNDLHQWVTKHDVGYPNAADDADHDEREPLKAAYSDALKRAAVQFGIGRHLYDKKPAAKPAPRREAPAASPVSQPPSIQAELLALMASENVTKEDIIAVTGAGTNGNPRPMVWLEKNPGKTVADLVMEAKLKAVPA